MADEEEKQDAAAEPEAPEEEPGESSEETAGGEGGETDRGPKPAAGSEAPAARGSVLVVDDDESFSEMVCDYFKGLGINVAAASDAREGLGKLSTDTRLVLTDLQMPGHDGMSFLRALRKKSSKLKVAIVTGHPDKETILQSRDLGVTAYLSKPVEMTRLRRLAEGALHLERPLSDLDLPEDYARALETEGLVPPFFEGSEPVLLEDIIGLAEKDPDRLAAEGIEVAAAYHTVNDVNKVGKLEGRDPAVREGARLNAGTVKVLKRFLGDKYGGVVNAEGKPVRALLMKRTPQLAAWLSEELFPEEDSLAQLLRRNRLSRMMLEREADGGIDAAMTALKTLLRHSDVIFSLYRVIRFEEGEGVDHCLAVALLSAQIAQELAAAGGGEVGDHAPLILALAGFFHDIGASLTHEYGSREYISARATHTRRGFSLFKGIELPDAVRYVVRDHHKASNSWHSPFDGVTRLVRAVNDLDNLTRRNGVIVEEGSVELSPAEVDLRDACRDMLMQARRGVYAESAIHAVMRLCGLSSLFEYYRQVEQIKNKPCAGVILAPDEVHPATALCAIEGSISRHEKNAYCSGRSPTRGHAHESKMYHRCLQGHEEITHLNSSVKHLDANTKKQLGLAAAEDQPPPAATDDEKPEKAEAAAAEGTEPETDDAEVADFEDEEDE